ncbi:kinase-like protein, partial [Schizopora paradoxa]
KEIQTISKLSHPNILPLTGYLVVDGFPAIVTPWVKRGSLFNKIQAGTLDTSDDFILRMARSIIDGLEYLHSENIVHGDLKSSNIMLSSTDKPLLADFGLPHIINEEMTITFTTITGSCSHIRWTAPEIFDGESNSNASDVWAFGMYCKEILSHKVPYYEASFDSMVVKKIIGGKHPSWPDVAEGPDATDSGFKRAARDVCEDCWCSRPDERPHIKRVGDRLIERVNIESDTFNRKCF